MQITFLGAAGLLLETAQALLLVDPWRAPQGALAAAWRPLSRSARPRFLCISHGHLERLEPALLALLPRDLTVVVAAPLRAPLPAQGFARVVTLEAGAALPLPGGALRLFPEEPAHDSALAVHADGQRLLFLNGCELRGALARSAAQEGPLDLLGARCAGRTEAVGRALAALEPRLFVACDGPLPDAARLPLDLRERARGPTAGGLDAQLRGLRTLRLQPVPGDVLDVERGSLGAEREEALQAPPGGEEAAVQVDLCAARAHADPQATLEQLHEALEERLSALGAPEPAPAPLYVSLEELPHRYLRVDFSLQLVERVPYISDTLRHALQVAAADIAPVLEGLRPWESLLRCARLRLQCAQEAEDPLLHGFLALETQALGPFRAALGRRLAAQRAQGGAPPALQLG